MHDVTSTRPNAGPVYRDRKRWAWLLSVLFPLLPLLGVWLHHVSGWEITLALTMVISYGLMPILDALIGEDLNNPPESAVPQLEADRYYRWLTWATVPLHFVTLIGCAWWAGTQHLSWGGIRHPGLQRRCRGRLGAEHRP